LTLSLPCPTDGVNSECASNLGSEPSKSDSDQAHSPERALYEETIRPHRLGLADVAIMVRLGIGRQKVKEWLRTGYDPDRQPPQPARCREWLRERWAEGCHRATQLWAEVRGMGFRGSYSALARWPAPGRAQRPADCEHERRRVPPHLAAVTLSKFRSELTPAQEPLLEELKLHPQLEALRQLVLRFRRMLGRSRGQTLASSLRAVRRSAFQALVSFSKTVQRDFAAAKRAIQMPWSNGPVGALSPS